jgi:hypothetical protein
VHYFSRTVNIYFCLRKKLLHAHFLAKLEVREGIFGSHIRTRYMEDAQRSYIHKEEIKRIHVNMGNVETKSSGRRGREELMELDDIVRIM